MDSLTAFFKFAAILLAGILGTIGLLVDFKDREGRITKWGQRALLATIASSLIAATLQGLEVYKQKKDAQATQAAQQAQNQRINALLASINRAVYPLEHLSFEVTTAFPLTGPALASYVNRLEAETARRTTQPLLPPGSPPDDTATTSLLLTEGQRRSVIGVSFSSASKLMPRRQQEPVAWRMTHPFGIDVKLFKRPVSWRWFQLSENWYRQMPSDSIRNIPQPDLTLSARATTVQLTYEAGTGHLLISSDHLPATERDWKAKGNIVSLTDLAGAQLVITPVDHDTGDDAIDLPYLEAEKGADIQQVLLRVGRYVFPIEGFQKLPHSKYPTYVYVFPPQLVAGALHP